MKHKPNPANFCLHGYFPKIPFVGKFCFSTIFDHNFRLKTPYDKIFKIGVIVIDASSISPISSKNGFFGFFRFQPV